jgi:class 3 adenylate cyclase
MARFALDALQIIDEINLKLNSLLGIRIGINTGGPILAGVLGTDRPAFDIIGDSINIEARLQSTDIAGKIQISASTQELLTRI